MTHGRGCMVMAVFLLMMLAVTGCSRSAGVSPPAEAADGRPEEADVTGMSEPDYAGSVNEQPSEDGNEAIDAEEKPDPEKTEMQADKAKEKSAVTANTGGDEANGADFGEAAETTAAEAVLAEEESKSVQAETDLSPEESEREQAETDLSPEESEREQAETDLSPEESKSVQAETDLSPEESESVQGEPVLSAKASESEQLGSDCVTEAGGSDSVAAPPTADSEAVPSAEEAGDLPNGGFYASDIPDDVFGFMQGRSYKADCPIPREDLRYLHLLYRTLDGETLEGEMVCHKAVADDLLDIFKELYDQGYPIEKIRLVDEYEAVDEASMTDNNSSCFNYRVISHTTTISKHGLGIAVDINPLYNPYTKLVDGVRTVEPAAGEPYLDRAADYPYKIDEEDLCYRLFLEHGFSWGGAWRNSKDYQHFELAGSRAEEVRALYSAG